jgi:hypothetical protein
LRQADPGQLRRCRKASRNDAAFLKTEIVAPARSRHADDDVVDQLELKDSAGFENSPGEAHIGFGRGGVARYAACGITGAMPYPVLFREELGFVSGEVLPDAA